METLLLVRHSWRWEQIILNVKPTLAEFASRRVPIIRPNVVLLLKGLRHIARHGRLGLVIVGLRLHGHRLRVGGVLRIVILRVDLLVALRVLLVSRHAVGLRRS